MCIRDRHRDVPFTLENRAEDLPLVSLVVDDEDRPLHPGAPSAGTPDGIAISIRVPFPWVESTKISPPWASTIFFVRTSPSPNPDTLVVKYGSKILSRSFTGMPVPVSSTTMEY